MKRFLLPLLLALALTGHFLGAAVFSERTVHLGDIRSFVGERDRFVRESLTSGEGLPRWAPGIYGGAPVLAAQEMALLYPPTVILALAGGERAPALGLAFHFLLGALGAWALARSLGAGRRAAAVASASYMFGGAILSAHTTPTYIASLAWTLWAATGIVRVATRERGGFALATASFLAIYLGGDPLGCIFAAITSLAIVGAMEPLATRRVAPVLVLAALLTALLGAAQLFPAVAVLDETLRAKGLNYEEAARWSFWPPEAAGLAVPFTFGDYQSPATLWFYAMSPGAERPWAEAYYVGPIVLALAGCGLLRLRRSALSRAGLLLILLFVPIALGRYTPLYELLYEHAPGVRAFRYPAKFMAFAMLGVALLAASGFDDLKRRRKPLLVVLGLFVAASLGALAYVHVNAEDLGATIDARGFRVVKGAAAMWALEPRLFHVALFAAAGAVVLAWPRRRLPAALAALVVLDLATALRPAILLVPGAALERAPRIAPILDDVAREDGVPARVLGFSSARMCLAEDAAATELWGRIDLANAEGLAPNAGLGRGVMSQDGFLSNRPLRWDVVFSRPMPLPTDAAIRGGARYILAANDDPSADGTVVRRLDSRKLVRIDRAPPWAAIYGHVQHVKDLDAAAIAIVSSAFDSRREAIVEAREQPCDPEVRGSAKLSGPFGLHGFALDVETSGPSWLVVREGFARGWTALVDGKEAPIAPADVMFRAVHLERGAHRVEFSFRAPLAREGVLVSALTALGLLAWALRRRRASIASFLAPRP
jgi:hypothetical protein